VDSRITNHPDMTFLLPGTVFQKLCLSRPPTPPCLCPLINKTDARKQIIQPLLYKRK
jgi:hypothetical protein